MNQFNDIVSLVKENTENNQHVVVAISGFGGSGKSYLADALADLFKIKRNQVIRIDCLYSTNPDGPGVLDQVDWENLESILKNIRSGDRLCYQGRGYRGEDLHFDEELPNIVIVEGIRLLQPRFAPYFDISIWIDCPQEFAIQRAKVRDRGQGESEEEVARWDTHWGPLDKTYFEEYRPDSLATMLFRENGLKKP